jgi:hypothetical protein
VVVVSRFLLLCGSCLSGRFLSPNYFGTSMRPHSAAQAVALKSHPQPLSFSQPSKSDRPLYAV